MHVVPPMPDVKRTIAPGSPIHWYVILVAALIISAPVVVCLVIVAYRYGVFRRMSDMLMNGDGRLEQEHTSSQSTLSHPLSQASSGTQRHSRTRSGRPSGTRSGQSSRRKSARSDPRLCSLPVSRTPRLVSLTRGSRPGKPPKPRPSSRPTSHPGSPPESEQATHSAT